MKRVSAKRRRREAEAKPFRDALKARVGRCEVCLSPRMVDDLAGHEIHNGYAGRQVSLDKAFGVLIVCREPNYRKQCDCHATVQNESEARQLARLYTVRPSDFDLPAFNAMVNPRASNRITLSEVMAEVRKLTELARD